MGIFWSDFLYRPLLNLLIWLYSNVAFNNLGLAVVWLSILVRLVLLPFSVIIERNKSIFQALGKRIDKIHQDFDKDPVLGREMMRMLLIKYKIRPWANVFLLLFQLLILVVLYQVFIGGINLSHSELYASVKAPQKIDTTFIRTFDVAQRNFFVSLFVALCLFFSIRNEYKGQKYLITQKNAFFLYLFPTITFFALYWLPSVKAVFIFTSMLFSYIIHFIQKPIYETIFSKSLKALAVANNTSAPASSAPSEEKKELAYSGNPWNSLRKGAKK